MLGQHKKNPKKQKKGGGIAAAVKWCRAGQKKNPELRRKRQQQSLHGQKPKRNLDACSAFHGERH